MKEKFGIDRATIEIEIQDTPTVYALANSQPCSVRSNDQSQPTPLFSGLANRF
ncbi:MAG: hypothetical protein ACLFTJ_14325 [Halothece sp.]